MHEKVIKLSGVPCETLCPTVEYFRLLMILGIYSENVREYFLFYAVCTNISIDGRIFLDKNLRRKRKYEESINQITRQSEYTNNSVFDDYFTVYLYIHYTFKLTILLPDLFTVW